jgi:hypothetical protein
LKPANITLHTYKLLILDFHEPALVIKLGLGQPQTLAHIPCCDLALAAIV